MRFQHDDHTFEVTGDWTGKWLFLAPQYRLEVDGQLLDELGGPRIRPTLEGDVEFPDGRTRRVQARLVSILGIRPRCEVFVDGQRMADDRVRVDNVLNPFLMLVILISTLVMLYVGPEVLRYYLPFV